MPRSADRGSVLVDALVAIGVMAVALTLGAEAVGDGARRTAEGERSRLATLEARSRLAEVGADIPLSAGRASGEDGALVWSVDIEPASGGDSATPLMAISVSVRDTNGAVLATLQSLRAGGEV
jgi:hypothetical protein